MSDALNALIYGLRDVLAGAGATLLNRRSKIWLRTGFVTTDDPDNARIIADVNGVELPEGTANGDLFYINGAEALVRIPAGTEGQVLTMVGGVPTWAAGGPAPFDPLSVGTPLVWYDVSQGTEGSGGTAGKLITLPDLSGNGNHAVIPAGEEPTYDATDATINNIPSMYFPASTTKRVDLPDDLGLTTGAFTVVWVGYTDGGGANPSYFTASDGNVEVIANATKDTLTADATTTILQDDGPAVITDPQVGIAVIKTDGTGKLYVNRKTPKTGAIKTGGTGPNMTGVTLCLGHYKALAANVNFAMSGAHSHFGVYNGELSQADCEYLLDGLGAIAGITIGA